MTPKPLRTLVRRKLFLRLFLEVVATATAVIAVFSSNLSAENTHALLLKVKPGYTLGGIIASLGIMPVDSKGEKAKALMQSNGITDLWSPIKSTQAVVRIPADIPKLGCNFKIDVASHSIEINEYLVDANSFLKFIRANGVRCISSYIPKEVNPADVKAFSGEYVIEEGDTLSDVLYNIGALPLWLKWGALEQSVRSSSGIRDRDKIHAGQLIIIKDLPAIRACNAHFEESHKRFHLSWPFNPTCKPEQEVNISSLSEQKLPEAKLSETPTTPPAPMKIEEAKIEAPAAKENAEVLFAESKAQASVAHKCQWDEALEKVRKAEAVDPTNAAYPIHEVRILYYAGRPEEAKKTARKLVDRHPQLEVVPLIYKITHTSLDQLPKRSSEDSCELLLGGQDSFAMPIARADPPPSPEKIPGAVGVSPKFDVQSKEPRLLAPNPAQGTFQGVPIERDAYSSKRFAMRTALQGKEQVAYMYKNEFLNKAPDGFKKEFNADFIVKDRHNCFDIQAFKPDLTEENLKLCVELSSKDLAQLALDNQAFYFRKNWGLWGQIGGSWVAQSIPPITAGGPSESSSVIGSRLGVGGWWHNFTAQALYRRTLADTGGKGYQPNWLNTLLGYGFEASPLGTFTPYFMPLLGVEFYSNNITSTGFKYVKSYQGLNLGFESRFIVGSNVELGGIFLWGYADVVTKYFIQADARYWFDNRNAFGGGFWLDSASQRGSDFKEKSTAIELYYRRLFDF